MSFVGLHDTEHLHVLLQGGEMALLAQLEDSTGGLLPELLSGQSLQLWPQAAQSNFLAALKKFAIAVLRHRYRSAQHLRLLTGLLAGLLQGRLSWQEA